MATETGKPEPWATGDFWVSPFNYEPGVVERPHMPGRVLIHDATLRDGEQTPGVVFRHEEKLAIARALDAIGVDRIEAGMPAVSAEDLQAIEAIAHLGLRAEVCCFSRALESDVDLAAACGVARIILEVPAGVPRLRYQYPTWTEERVVNTSVRTCAYARDKGLAVTFFLMDASRAERGFLERLLGRVSKESPPDSVTLADTAGCLLPAAAASLVGLAREATGLPVEIHCHNDLGLGLADTLAALEAGAEVAHVCVNGLGERTGNVALDELATALHCLYGQRTNIDYRHLTELSKLVERLSNIPLARNKPVVGDGTFCRESGLGIDLVKQQPLAIYSLAPWFAGQNTRIVLGKKSGVASIRVKAEELGIGGLDEGQMRAVLEQVKQVSIEQKRTLDDDEFRAIVTEVMARQ